MKIINNIFCDDSTKFFKKIDKQNSKLVITSPTYYSDIKKRLNKNGEIIGGNSKDKYIKLIEKMSCSILRHLDKKGKIIFIIGTEDDSYIKSIVYMLEESLLKLGLHLNCFKEFGDLKSEAILIFSRESNLSCDIPSFDFIQDYRGDNIKFGILNKKIIEWAIKKFTHKGELVIDPLVGVGTTILVAKDMGRNFIGVDINENNIELAREFLKN